MQKTEERRGALGTNHITGLWALPCLPYILTGALWGHVETRH